MDETKNEIKEQKGGYKIIKVTGNFNKFAAQMLDVANHLELHKNVVIMGIDDRQVDRDPETAAVYERVMLHNLDVCDCLYVVNPDDKIPEMVQKEIDYVRRKGKAVCYSNPPKPYIVTLCGSGKYRSYFNVEKRRLIREGKVVLTPAIFDLLDGEQAITWDDHRTLDLLHEKKMMMSDEVRFINPGDYMGEDTLKELQFCIYQGLHVSFLQWPQDPRYQPFLDALGLTTVENADG